MPEPICLFILSYFGPPRLTPFFSTGSPYTKWRPVLDGSIISSYPTLALESGNFAREPVIAGYVLKIPL